MYSGNKNKDFLTTHSLHLGKQSLKDENEPQQTMANGQLSVSMDNSSADFQPVKHFKPSSVLHFFKATIGKDFRIL